MNDIVNDILDSLYCSVVLNGILYYCWQYHWILRKYHWMVQWYSMAISGIPLALFFGKGSHGDLYVDSFVKFSLEWAQYRNSSGLFPAHLFFQRRVFSGHCLRRQVCEDFHTAVTRQVDHGKVMWSVTWQLENGRHQIQLEKYKLVRSPDRYTVHRLI